MVGRRPAYRVEELDDIFQDFKENIVENDKIIRPSSKIWVEIQKNHLPAIAAKAIYSAARRWWTKEKHIDKDNHPSSDLSIETNPEDSSEVNNSTISNERESSIKFSIYLSREVWKTVAPVSVSYNRKADKCHKGNPRTYYVLPKGVWTNLLVEKIAAHRKNIICNWAFNRCKVYLTGSRYVVISAKCSTCKASLAGFVERKSEYESDAIQFKFTVYDFNAKIHEIKTKNVRNVGLVANGFFKSSKPALALHREAARSTEMFKQPKGRTSTLNSIRCGKYRQRVKANLSTCPYTALEYLQESFAYVDTIHMNCRNPFCLIYRSPNQLRLYKAYMKKHVYTKVTCDATGGLAHQLARPGEKSSEPILLYSMVISDEFQISIHNMLSEMQHANIISFWLSEWIRLGGSIPNEFVCDISMALISGAVRAFGLKSSISDYMNTLFNLHNGIEDVKPKCFVRIDIAHLMKIVVNCKQLKSARMKHRDFFIRCVALMIKMKSLTQAREHILSVLVCALSLTEGASTNSGTEVVSEKHKRGIINKIKGIDNIDQESINAATVEEEPNADQDLESNVDHGLLSNGDDCEIKMNKCRQELMEYVDSEKSKLTMWIDDILIEAKSLVQNSDDGDRDNLMYNPGFAKYFCNLSKLLLFWTSICCEVFNSPYEIGTSANSESEFKDVKLSLKFVVPCSVDEFIKHHLDMLDGAVKLASRKYVTLLGEQTGEIDENIEIKEAEIASQRKVVFEQSGCVACENNDLPSGAHKCYVCGKRVHILSGCSSSIGEEEGYGQRRICLSCQNLSPNIPKPKSATNEKDYVDSKTNEGNKDYPTEVVSCKACLNGHFPNEAYQCYTCDKNVHLFSDCSTLIGKYRLCSSCYIPTSESEKSSDESISRKSKKESKPQNMECVAPESINDELQCTEKWNKRKRTKRSSYIKPSPNWDLNTNVDKKLILGVLSNGSVSKTIHHVNKVAVTLSNTCAFDVVAQTLAAAYAYNAHFREVCEQSKDEVFQIAMLLAKNASQKKINNLRAALLYNVFHRESFNMVVTDMIRNILRNTGSYKEVLDCNNEQCMNSQEKVFPVVCVNPTVYDDNLKTLELAIEGNFPQSKCVICDSIVATTREFGKHLFIELPSCSISAATASNYEGSKYHKLNDVPLALTIDKRKYALFAQIIFQPPYWENDIGHYTAVIKLNNTWEIYDDLRPRPYSILGNAKVVIHSLMYILCVSTD